ncbi:hypothetical protein P4N68_03785 [Corynebacterium felinum]|nr:hypothetical protein [Corynebacterium felinum]MDF5820205.1 hypothetical protein [Corynebacterium felinum]WJY94204.1 hypothetical protein CFELI_02810 [Corynebacterium felinum]
MLVFMDVLELNGGRFYLRPLHNDDRIDDRPALATVMDNPDEFIKQMRASDSDYCWAICEQTNVDMVALGHYDHRTKTITTTPIGDPERILPNDPVLPPKSVADAAEAGHGVIARWVAAALD